MENTEFEYISDASMPCGEHCEALTKGMIGKYEGDSNTILDNLEPHFLFDNGFIVELSFIRSRTDLFKEITK